MSPGVAIQFVQCAKNLMLAGWDLLMSAVEHKQVFTAAEL